MKLNKIKKQQLKNLSNNNLNKQQTADVAGGTYTNPAMTCISCLTNCPLYRCPTFDGC
ncbi:TIGR04149 family rSAM-modified RiPP [Pseudoalteromonas fenneropenaei]|uniref:TIGR04149 family rSAM-modified RiPP n=1 Tax=Pseudoalteromonas fenneropenaei TaxID=1737459 RepID=A0ABV7CP86_9GAMM